MRSSDRALRALRAQVQFQLAQIAPEVASAAVVRASWQERAADFAKRSEVASSELRGALCRQPINPALLVTMRRMYQYEHRAFDEARAQAEEAQRHEQRARDALANLRNRDHSLERALQAERRRQDLKLQVKEIEHADDWWLQRLWRETL